MWRHFAGRNFPLEGFCERLFPVEGFKLGGISPHSPSVHSVAIFFKNFWSQLQLVFQWHTQPLKSVQKSETEIYCDF